jgi:hypothetical protein
MKFGGDVGLKVESEVGVLHQAEGEDDTSKNVIL